MYFPPLVTPGLRLAAHTEVHTYDVAQCGYCQPGQIMAAVALVKLVRSENREVTGADLDSLRNICRCGTYSRIRKAIADGAKNM